MVDGGSFMATEGAAGINSHPPSSLVQWSGEGVSSRSQEERDLA